MIHVFEPGEGRAPHSPRSRESSTSAQVPMPSSIAQQAASGSWNLLPPGSADPPGCAGATRRFFVLARSPPVPVCAARPPRRRCAPGIVAVMLREHPQTLPIVLAILACTPTRPPEPQVVPAGGDDAAPPAKCGARSSGMHRPGDSLEAIAQRKLGGLACATACDPKPAFATRPLARNEHGGYGFLDVTTDVCQSPGMNLPISGCHATCDGHDRLGRLDVETRPASDSSRATLCRALTAERGPASVGSCDCLEHDIVWLPSATLAGVVLHHQGTYTLDCGFPEAHYAPTREPG